MRLHGVRGRASLVATAILAATWSIAEAPTPTANIIVVLDSSGSMREAADAQDSGDPLGLVDSPDEGELVGDSPSSKLAQAKRVLSEVIQASPASLRFHLGTYRQSTTPKDFGPELRDRFLYATSDPGAAQVVVNPSGDGASPPGIKRSPREQRAAGGGTTYYLFAGRLWNGETIQVLPDGSEARVARSGAGGNPAFVDVQRRSRSGQPLGPAVRFTLQGIRWNKANRQEDPANRAAVLIDNASCGGFAPLTSDRAELDRYLGAEIRIMDGGAIEGFADGPLGAAPAAPPKEHGIRASGLTPLAGTFIDIRKLLGSTWRGLLDARTFVVLLTDGDDTCADDHTGDLTVSHGDDRALRAAYHAELLRRETGVPGLVVAFGTAVSARRAQWIAWGGSGMSRAAVGEGTAARWATAPSPADRAQCRSCSDAITAQSASELAAGLRAAIQRGLESSRP